MSKSDKTIVTIQGERWDQLSLRATGKPNLYREIIDNNPQVPPEILYLPTLPGGIELNISGMVEYTGGTAGSNNKPPWRR